MAKWAPATGETVRDRLAAIVGAAMGYEPEDLPWEVPLIEFGLDSLMAVRIKNRVEYDFDLPPIQLRAVRDANLCDVKTLIEYAIEHRDEVAALRQYQQTTTSVPIATYQAARRGGASPGGFDPSRQANSVVAAQPHVRDHQPAARALNWNVPPRDAAERITFATWAIVTGKSPGGIFNQLPRLSDSAAAEVAQRLSERAKGIVTAVDAQAAPTIEALATTVRGFLEAGKVDGFVRIIRAGGERNGQIPVFVFHPAGGSTAVYEPLLKRLPSDTPMYGFERVEGSIEQRVRQYVPKLLEFQGNGPFILAGWSLGGALAYACAIGLTEAGADVRFVGLIDTVHAGKGVPETKEETRARWHRYARFAERTFNVEIGQIPYERLEQLDDEGHVKFVLDAITQSGVEIPGGIVEHQRTSYLDHRAIDTATVRPYDGRVTLYIADRHHEDAITFEPRYAIRKPDGGWGEYVSDLEVVQIGGDHIQAIDEPYIATVGKHMSEAITRIADY